MFLTKKKPGDSAVAGGMVATILSLAVIFMAVFTYASWQTELLHTYETDLVLHKYLVQLESIDYSSQTEIDGIFNLLEEELADHGISNISFEGSSMSPQATGSKITLHVTGSMQLSFVEMSENAGLEGAHTTTRDVRFDITKTGTAMY